MLCLKLILTIFLFTAPISPPLLCFCCPFLGPGFLQNMHSLLLGLLFLSFYVKVHPTDNTSLHPLFSPLVPFAGSCHVPGFSSSPFFSQCFLPALVLHFASHVSTWLLCLRLPIQLENMSLYRFE